MRCCKYYNKDQFIQNLDDIDRLDVFSCGNVDNAWDKFKSISLSILNKVAPYKEVQVTHRITPWMSNEILNLIRQTDKYLPNLGSQKINRTTNCLFTIEIRSNTKKKTLNLSIMYML